MVFIPGVYLHCRCGAFGAYDLGNTLLMYYTEDKYRGRVMSFYEMDHGLTSLGTFGAGLLAGAIGAPWALGGFAIILVLLSVLALAFVPRVRNLE